MNYKRPKRRKDKYNPYTLSIENNMYYVSFMDTNKCMQKIEVDKDVFNALDSFELDDVSFMNEAERHYEFSELSESALNNRAVIKPKTVEESFMEKLKKDELDNIISSLTETQRKRMIYYYFENMTFKQIAALEGCAYQTVQKSIEKVKDKIKKILS